MVKPLEKPSKLYRILGGNCLFRALSYAITGRQNYHSLVREKIVQHIRHKEHALLAHMNGSVNEYLARTGMTNQHVWGTDIEIIAASSLLETDIYVYTKVGFLYKWQRFSSSILSGYPAKNIGGLYLQNTSGVHYDIVLDVASSLTPHSNHGCKRKRNNEQSHHCKTKSVSISQPLKLAKANHVTDTSKHVSFTLSNREDLAHISSDSDSKLTSNNTMSTQNTDSDNEIHVKSIKNKEKPFIFACCHTERQAVWCSALDLPLIVKHKNSSELVKPLEKPSKLYRILGDGNCLFRALSYAITGRQNYHSLVRQKIVQHIRHKEHALLAHMNGSVNEYLARTGMTNQHVWGTDIEIIAASSLLETDIYVYTKIGFLYKWQRFSSSILSGYPAKNIGGLYLQNTSGVHYDIVLDVASSLTPHSNHGCKRKQNREQSHHHKTKSVSISQPSKIVKANHAADSSKHVSFTLSNTEDLAHINTDSGFRVLSYQDILPKI